MNFDEMQALWKSQNDEKLFAINEAALYAALQHKTRVINNLVGLLEGVMIVLNLMVGIVLILDVLRENGAGYRLIVPVIYLLSSMYALLQRLRRRAGEVHFESTLLGELDRAIWRVEYLIQQGRSITLYYMVPLTVTILITSFLGHKPLWPAILMSLMIPLSHYGTRWEINKWYLPKKRALLSLRETLTANENQSFK
jgi:hypothetical protein